MCFFDIYLNCCRSVERLKEIGAERLNWHKKFKKTLKDKVKEKTHIQYKLTHMTPKKESVEKSRIYENNEKFKSFFNENYNNNNNSRKTMKRRSFWERSSTLLDERVSDFLGKSMDLIENYSKIEKNEKKGKFNDKKEKFENFNEKFFEQNNEKSYF